MTSFRQHLIIKRLLVVSGRKQVYDQEFFAGVNIIRGDNGTGKSTVMDLLFFVLGGDVKEWTEEQSRCNYVMCEVEASGKTLTLKREIANSTSMFIYEGALDPEAPSSAFLALPYRVSERKESFSQVLFDYLNLPRYQKDDSVTLTMHQILRLIYVDQITPPNKILRQEPSNFDSYSNRLAIGEYLLGIDDLGSHTLRQEKNRLEKEADSINVERRAIYKVLGRHSIIADEERLKEEIAELAQEKLKLQSSVLSLDKRQVEESAVASVQDVVAKISAQKELILSLEKRRNQLSDEVIDGELFVDSLTFRLRSIDEAAEVSRDIGGMEFKFCPSCLTPLSKGTDHGTCSLCKTNNVLQPRGRGYLAERTSLNFQLAESINILERNSATLTELLRKIKQESTNLALLVDSYKLMGGSPRSDDPVYYESAIRLGFIEKQLESLSENLEIVREVDATTQKLIDINAKVERIKDQLEATLEKTAGRRDAVASKISDLVVDILKHDLGYETAFAQASHFDFNFGQDAMRLDGKSKFSASSMTLLKNAFRFAIFYLSVQDLEMRYPRLLIMDNIEDKGMVPERSQAFQRTIVEYCSHLSNTYQLIFTTSMIDPGLNKSEFCRGINYPKGQHTLSF